MSSQAYDDFENRLNEIDQLLDAHSALTRLRRAEAAWHQGNGNLANVGEVINHLVSDPGRGRPYEVHALNSAAVALLSAHFQGFITDIFSQSVQHLMHGRVENVDAIVKAAPTRGNPNQANIDRLFGIVGFASLVAELSWQGASNDSVRRRLRELNELRNQIVHGSAEGITKARVQGFYSFVWTFADRFDLLLHRRLSEAVGAEPWSYQ